MVEQKVQAVQSKQESTIGLADLMGWTVRLDSDLVGRCYLSINDIGQETLNNITRQQVFWASKAWFACLEAMPDIRLLYICIENKTGKLMGMMPCQFVTDERTMIFYNIPRMIVRGGNFGCIDLLSPEEVSELKKLQSQLAENINSLYPSIVAASPNSYCALCLDPCLCNERRKDVVYALSEMFDRVASRLKCKSSGFLYLHGEAKKAVGEALKHGDYIQAIMGADCVMPVRWQTFDEYLQVFSSNRRYNIRRERKIFNSSGIEVKVTRGSQALSQELIALQMALREKYGVGGSPDNIEKRFMAMREHLGESIVVFTAIYKEEILGFVLFFEYDSILYSYIAGFNYDRLTNEFCYLNLVMYEPLIWAMQNGIKHIHFGLSAYEAKLLRGCILHECMGFFTFRGKFSPFAQRVVQLFAESEGRSLDSYRSLTPSKLNIT